MISKRDARPPAGSRQANPLAGSLARDATIDGDRAKEKASSENDPKLSVEIVKNCSTEAMPRPSSPPANASVNDSIKNARRILRWKQT